MTAERKKLVMCQACRALVPASEKTCPMCGRESVPARAFLHATTGGHFISVIILTINILLFVLMAMLDIRNGAGAEAFMKSASGTVLAGMGALYPGALAAGEWWRLVTWNFLHIGVVHLLFNSIALYQIGPQVEEVFGSAKFIFIYLATGIAAGLVSLALKPSFTAGASGALFGLIGLMAVYGYRLGGVYGRALMKSMLVWAAFGFVVGLSPGVNNIAHGGGFVAGGALGFLVPAESSTTRRSARAWNAVLILCVLAVAGSFAMAGRSFNAMQEREAQAKERADDAAKVITLSQLMRSAHAAVDDSRAADPSKANPQQTADALRKAARDLSGAPSVDDRSDQIKQQYAELLAKRADAFAAAAKDKSLLPRAVLAESEASENVFHDYYTWEESVLEKYGLERVRD
jgi:rhomboid protease GluP